MKTKEYLIAIAFSISMVFGLIAISDDIDTIITENNGSSNKNEYPRQLQIKDVSELKKHVDMNNIPEHIKRKINR